MSRLPDMKALGAAIVLAALVGGGPMSVATAQTAGAGVSKKTPPSPIRKAPTGPVSKSPPAMPPCDNGEDRDESGGCPVVDDAPATRGFELFAGAMDTPRGPLTPVSPPSAPVVAQASSIAGCGQFCDLKITFKSGSATLTPQSRRKLAVFLKALGAPALADKHFEIAGHTDASGSPTRNLALSLARAQAVEAFLVTNGFDAARLQAKGYGAEGLAVPDHPLDPGNRRVEARILD